MNITPVFDTSIIRAVAITIAEGKEATDTPVIEDNQNFWFCLPPVEEAEAFLVVQDNVWYFVVWTGRDDSDNDNAQRYHAWQFSIDG